MTAGAQVDWVPGFSRRWWATGFFSILYGSMAVAQLVAYALGLWSHQDTSWTALFLSLGISAAIGLPGAFCYAILIPSTARLGIMADGVIVEAASRYPQYGFRQGYRWGDLQLRGRSLILPPIRPRAPRSLHLTGAQLEQVARQISPR